VTPGQPVEDRENNCVAPAADQGKPVPSEAGPFIPPDGGVVTDARAPRKPRPAPPVFDGSVPPDPGR
jgi:hypothetical protein